MWDFTLPVMNPFETPGPKKLAGNDELSLFTTPTTTQMIASKNICTIWKAGLWDNTLVIILGDHGHRLPPTKSKIDDFAIPMIWIGGVIDTTFNQAKTTSQTDLMPTLLAQLARCPCALPSVKCLIGPGPEWAFLLLTMALGMWIKTMLWCLTMRKRVIEQRGKTLDPQ